MSNNNSKWGSYSGGGGRRDDSREWNRPRHSHGQYHNGNGGRDNYSNYGSGAAYGRGRDQCNGDRNHYSNGNRNRQHYVYGERNHDNDSRRREEMDRKPPPEERDAKKHKPDDSAKHPTALTAASTPAATATATDRSTSTAGEPALVTEEDYRRQYFAAIRDQDKSTRHVPPQAFQVKEGQNEIQQRKAAARKVLEQLQKITSVPSKSTGGAQQYDTSGSEDEFSEEEANINKGPVLTQSHRKFILALPYCVPLDAGFNVISCRKGDDEHCSCPMGRMVKPWREQLGIPDEECKATSFTPNSLMDHLKAEGGVFTNKDGYHPLKDIYHHGARLYLQYLYSDWHHKIGVGHKALYPVSTTEWKKAANEETRVIMKNHEETIKELQLVKEKARKKEEEYIKLEHLSKQQYEKIKQLLKSEREKLNVKENVQASTPDRDVVKFKNNVMCYFNARRDDIAYSKALQIVIDEKEACESQSVGYSLQDLFDALYDKSEKEGGDARLTLFGNYCDQGVNDRITKWILSTWEIKFDKKVKYGSQAQKKKHTGIDKGGPSRQFLSDLFKQLDSLSVPVEGRDKETGKQRTCLVQLFEESSKGPLPTTDAKFKSQVKEISTYLPEQEIKKAIKKATKRAKIYCRAIGRIILHAFAHEQTLPRNALPSFFVRVLLHGYNEDFLRDDVLKYIIDNGLLANEETLSYCVNNDEFLDDKRNQYTPDTIFTKLVPTRYIYSRKIILGSLSDGMTFGGNPDASKNLDRGCGLVGLLSVVPFDAIQKIWFAKPTIELKDVLEILRPVYNIIEDAEWEGGEAERKRLQERQEKFFNEVFKTYLEEECSKKEIVQSDTTFLQRFVKCSTGYEYLPHALEGGSEFDIKIEFDHHMNPMDLPLFHTCGRELRLPGGEASHIFGDYKIFRDNKMKLAIETAFKSFHME